MKIKHPIRIILTLILAAFVYSLLPLLSLYLQKTPVPPTNEQVIEKLKKHKGNYFEFITFGDNHSGLIFDDSASLRLASRMNKEERFKKVPVDFVLSTGDVTFRGTEWDYRNYYKLISRIKWPVISAIGNHDDDNKGLPRFEKHIGKDEFSFINRNSYFIVANNSNSDLTEEQFAWLESELKKSEAYKHRFVVIHKPPMAFYQQSWYRPELTRWSYRFMKLCEKYKVDIVFSGHEHMFKTGVYGGVRYIVSGGGGIITKVPEADGGYLNYIVVRVYDDYLDFEVRKIMPPFWEYLTYYMWKNLIYFFKDAFL
jgi:serine/threonine-protein phosphatase CPPED1